MWPLLEKLGVLKNKNIALNDSQIGAKMNRIETGNNNVLMFSREHNGLKLTYVANLSNKLQTFDAKDTSDRTDYMTNGIVSALDNKLTFKPWEYHIFTD